MHALCLLRRLIVTQLERCTRSIGKGRNLSDLKRVLWSGTGTIHKNEAMGVGFEREDYQFLKELGLAPHNLGCFSGGIWKGNGPIITSVNPSDNKVLIQATVIIPCVL